MSGRVRAINALRFENRESTVSKQSSQIGRDVTNRYGDIELDAHGMRALAHPVRLAILTQLQKEGPQTATGLSQHVGASPSVTSWHLRHLAKHGLVRDAEALGNGRERWWESVSRGFRVIVNDEVGRRAAQALRDVLDETEGDQVGDWRRDVEPSLELEWLALSGLANTTILATREELEHVEAAMEELLAPYVLRKDPSAADVPDQARVVRIRRHVLPAAAAHDGSDAQDRKA